MAHIGNRDMLVMTVAVVLAGFVAVVADMLSRSLMYGDGKDRSPIFLILGIAGIILAPLAANMIKLAISRKREYLADATGALLTRYPEGLASALQKISANHQPLQRVSHATAHLFIADPYSDSDEMTMGKRINNLFATHPPVESRIQLLREMGK